jgi:hypothetical protein
MEKRYRTDFLFATPSFFSGVARVLDLGGTFDSYSSSKSPEEADSRAFNNDLSVILQDFQDAVIAARERLEVNG